MRRRVTLDLPMFASLPGVIEEDIFIYLRTLSAAFSSVSSQLEKLILCFELLCEIEEDQSLVGLMIREHERGERDDDIFDLIDKRSEAMRFHFMPLEFGAVTLHNIIMTCDAIPKIAAKHPFIGENLDRSAVKKANSSLFKNRKSVEEIRNWVCHPEGYYKDGDYMGNHSLNKEYETPLFTGKIGGIYNISSNYSMNITWKGKLHNFTLDRELIETVEMSLSLYRQALLPLERAIMARNATYGEQ